MTEADQPGPNSEGTVVLDIGGDVGALVVHTDASMHLVEIEISPVDDQGEDVFQAANPHHPAEHTHADGHVHGDDHEHGAHTHEHGTPVHEHTPGTTHVAVLERRGSNGARYAAIYPGLREGDYTLWRPDGTAETTVSIVGGRVTEYTWS